MDDFKQIAIESARDLAIMLVRDFARGAGVSHWEQSSRFVAATNAISRLGQLVNMADQPKGPTAGGPTLNMTWESRRGFIYAQVFADLEFGYCMKSESTGYIWRIWGSDKTNGRGIQGWEPSISSWAEESVYLSEDICNIPISGWTRCDNPETGASK